MFDGGGYIISNLTLKVLKDDFLSDSLYRGIFETNYGIISNIKFVNVIYDLTLYQDDMDKIFGFITPCGDVYNVYYSECYYKYMKYNKPLIGKGKWVTKNKEVTTNNQYNF